jgi:hypothetical protein
MSPKPRTLEHNGFNAEFVGPTRKIALFINNEWTERYFQSIKSAKAYFLAYVYIHTKRHA